MLLNTQTLLLILSTTTRPANYPQNPLENEEHVWWAGRPGKEPTKPVLTNRLCACRAVLVPAEEPVPLGKSQSGIAREMFFGLVRFFWANGLLCPVPGISQARIKVLYEAYPYRHESQAGQKRGEAKEGGQAASVDQDIQSKAQGELRNGEGYMSVPATWAA
eukprot:1155431-Pelagomonas_calceolata.AAC.1